MRCFYQINSRGEPVNGCTYSAADGFGSLGIETIPFVHLPSPDATLADVVVGRMGAVRGAVARWTGKAPAPLDYPEALRPFLERKVWHTTLSELFSEPHRWPVFVKPADYAKQFEARVLRTAEDFGQVDLDAGACWRGYQGNVWCSEVVSWKAEWRVFVLRGEVLDVRQYRGDWREQPDATGVLRAVGAYQSGIIEYNSAAVQCGPAPAAYGMDMGRLADGRWALVEVNDAYDLGSYGLEVEGYARMLSARWAEMVGVGDGLEKMDNE